MFDNVIKLKFFKNVTYISAVISYILKYFGPGALIV